MKHLLIFILTLLFSTSLFSQMNPWIGISPGGAKKVNGLMFNLFPNMEEDSETTIIKGLELEISPVAPLLFALTWAPVGFGDHSWRSETKNLETIKNISGVHLGLVNLEPTKIDGLEINVISLNSHCSGLSIAGMNIVDEINGVSIGIIRNYSEKCDGVQVGLINETADLNGFQFGLWNKNNKRSLPFINWSFSNDEESD